MNKSIDKKRALSFKENARLYDEMRPAYPGSWTKDLQEITGLNAKSRILEVGSGTGNATSDLIQISNHITCLDPAQEMIEIAENKFPRLTFVNSNFEELKSDKTYDLIISAMAWHWINPEVGYNKAWSLLANKGFLAVIRYYHIDADPRSFHNRAQHIYEKYNKATKTKRHSEQLKQIKKDASTLNNRYFHLLKKIEYKWEQKYLIEDYIALRNTYSDHITMSPQQKAKMEKELMDLAQNEFNGKLVKRYTFVLFIARKK